MKMLKSVQKSTKQRRLLIIGVAAEVVILVILAVVLVQMNLSNTDQTVATKYSVGRTLVNDDMKKLPHDTYNYMLRHLHDDGTYDYEINLDTGELSSSYNLMRHTGSTWGLLEAYPKLKNSDADLTKIQTAVDYLLERIKYKDTTTAFVIDTAEWQGANRVAENALAALTFMRLYDITNDDKHLATARALTDGLLTMQAESGQYYHEMSDNYLGTKLGKGSLYDGEINFAFASIYKYTHDDKYLAAIHKSVNFLQDDEYLMRRDQWLSYVARELLEAEVNDLAPTFLANLRKNLKGTDSSTHLCDMEYLGNFMKFLEILLERDGAVSVSRDELADLYEELKGVYYRRAVTGIRTIYASEQNGITNPDYHGAFMYDGHKARIDASQHNLAGYRMFYDYFYSTESPDALARYTEVRIKPREGENPYVALARRAVETYVRTRETISVPNGLPGELLEENKKAERLEGGLYGGGQGVYVTIRNHGKLRGCKGSYYATKENLAEEIIAQAIKTATKDTRMTPVSADELDDLAYEVSILDEPVKITDKGELNPDIYGIIIEQEGEKRSILLPGLDTVSGIDNQIAKALAKDNISPDENYNIWRFTTTKYE